MQSQLIELLNEKLNIIDNAFNDVINEIFETTYLADEREDFNEINNILMSYQTGLQDTINEFETLRRFVVGQKTKQTREFMESVCNDIDSLPSCI